MLRSGGRLAVSLPNGGPNWQKTPWSAVPEVLKDKSNLAAPSESVQLVRSDAGVRGGYRLAKTPDNISLKEIYETETGSTSSTVKR